MTIVTEMYARGGVSGPRRRRQAHVIAFGLAGQDWDTLVEMAIAQSRDPEQQARWIVLQAIRLFAEEAAS